MSFAPINNNLEFWQKQKADAPLFANLAWNIPEQKTGQVLVAGGNAQSFATVMRTAEYLANNFPLNHVEILLPEALRSKIPTIANINFTAATSTGTFAKSPLLNDYFAKSSMTLLAGDLSRNAETAIALTDAIKTVTGPLLITRDAVDLLAPAGEQLLMLPKLFLIASMAQLQKVFRAVYYPRMIMLSQPLVPTSETLHKFTLTYATTILTFHQDNIIVAHNGQVSTTPIAETDYSPLSLWSGQLAAKVAALNLFNPEHPFEATTAAVTYQKADY